MKGKVSSVFNLHEQPTANTCGRDAVTIHFHFPSPLEFASKCQVKQLQANIIFPQDP